MYFVYAKAGGQVMPIVIGTSDGLTDGKRKAIRWLKVECGKGSASKPWKEFGTDGQFSHSAADYEVGDKAGKLVVQLVTPAV